MTTGAPTAALLRDEEIRQSLARVFEQAMADGRTPPLAAFEIIARALGAIYRDVAAAHLDPSGCPCGWRPTGQDLPSISSALNEGARPRQQARPSLSAMTPIGRA